MHRPALLLLGLLTAPAAAQVTFTASTLSPLQVQTTGGTPDSLPANTNLTGTISIQSNSATPPSSASALTRITVDTTDPMAQSMRIEDLADAATTLASIGSTAACGVQQGPLLAHEVLVSVQASTAVFGAFEVVCQGTVHNGAVSQYIDVGNDGTFDLISYGQPRTLRFPVAFGPGTALLRTRTGSLATVNASTPLQSRAHGMLTVRFLPDPGCSVLTAAPACGQGPRLATRDNFLRGVDLVATGLPAQGVGALVAGMAPLGMSLPLPPGCLLHTDVGVWLAVPANAALRYELGLDMRRLSRPTSFRVQLLWWDPVTGRLPSTETLLLVCL